MTPEKVNLAIKSGRAKFDFKKMLKELGHDPNLAYVTITENVKGDFAINIRSKDANLEKYLIWTKYNNLIDWLKN